MSNRLCETRDVRAATAAIRVIVSRSVALAASVVWIASITNAQAAPTLGLLTLQDAEKISISSDPLIAETEAIEESYRQKSVAANTWPDPMLKLGILDVPLDTYDLEQEPMTRMAVGLSQRFPPWGSVGSQSRRMAEMAGATAAEVKDRELRTRLAVRQSWMEVYYQYQAEQLITQSITVFDQLKEITRLQYRAGRGSQRDVINAQLEKSLLRDQQTMIHTQWLAAKAQLGKWLGQADLLENMDMEFPTLREPSTVEQLRKNIEQHPVVQAQKSRVSAAESGVDYARAQRWPGWSLDLVYGARGAERSDLGSAMINFDLPLFTGSRQSREIKASQAELTASQNKVDDQRRQLLERLGIQSSVYAQVDERLKLYESNVLPEAKQNTETSLTAYQAGVIEFGILVRAQLTELNSELQYLKLKVDKAKAQVELLYLGGS